MRRFSAPCSSRRSRGVPPIEGSSGYTLIEVLTALALASAVAVAVGTAFVFATRSWREHQARLETQQSLRATIETLSREVRLAGACQLGRQFVPPASFQPVDGADAGTLDTITVRTNPPCAIGTLTPAGGDCDACTTITLDNVQSFTAGGWAYIYNPNGSPAPYGEYFRVAAVDTVNNTLTVDQTACLTITRNYPLGSDSTQPSPSVYGIEVRTYNIQTISGTPALTVTMLCGPPQPLVTGIDVLDIRYTLNRTYDAGTCDLATGGTPDLCIVNLPASAQDWRNVRLLTVTVDAVSTRPVRAASPDGFFHLRETFQVAPRNFTFPVAPGRL